MKDLEVISECCALNVGSYRLVSPIYLHVLAMELVGRFLGKKNPRQARVS